MSQSRSEDLGFGLLLLPVSLLFILAIVAGLFLTLQTPPQTDGRPAAPIHQPVG
jgi:hypothetical protein